MLQNKAARLILVLPAHSSASYVITIFATRFQSYLMAIFTVIIPGREIISANPPPIENGAPGRQLILVQKSRTD